VAHVIREDDGKGQLAKEFGSYSYRTIFKSSQGTIAEEYEIPEEYRLDIGSATDAQVLDGVAKVMDAYMTSLFFSRNHQVEYDGSPYDTFLEKNELPRKVVFGQEAAYYSRNILSVVTNIPVVRFVSPADNCFRLLKQDFRFNKEELEGMKIFFTRPSATGKSKAGNCIACHTPPDFTDFQFHNTGVSQAEYDTVHGKGAFAKIAIPDLAGRNRNYEKYLPATGKHPNARGPFLDIPSADHPERVDLGLWNVFANPDHPGVQKALHETLDPERKMSDERLLERSFAAFKTPCLRGLVMSAPYMHNGSKDTIEDVIRFYIKSSRQARAGEVRNADPELAKIFLTDDDVEPLAAFLRALNEDYE
jgi:cytochrome c peroxidase